MRALFTVTILLGSLLLFLIQPMVAKMVLPFFGGTPGVWNTSLVFFQAALLAGYAYAHYGPKLLGTRIHSIVHLMLFAVGVILLPFGVQSGFNPAHSSMPEWATLLGFLCVAVGLPYFVVSAGAPLLQRWFSRTGDPAAHDPYFLYAASNVGSIAALLGYPLWFEGAFSLSNQVQNWTWCYIGLAGLVLLCALVGFRKTEEKHEALPTPAPALPTRLRWIALAAVPTSLLMGVTTYLTTNLASIPLLWVVPLTIYLLTFILAFKSKRLFQSAKLARWIALLLAPMSLMMVLEATEPFWFLASIHLLVFFLAGLACHTELAETRPTADHLTEFYLWISVGGVIGGIFNAIVAPMVFGTLAEYPIALVALLALRWKPGDRRPTKIDILWPIGVGLATVLFWMLAVRLGMPPGTPRTALTMGLPALLCFLAIDSPVRLSLSIGAFLLLAQILGIALEGRIIAAERSFFGVHRVTENRKFGFRQLVHGNTIHGRQHLDPKKQKTPLTYYYPTGPIGQVMETYLPLWKPAHVGLVGLGVGSLASYGRPGDQFTFFEIDPIVIEIASNPKLFTYVSDCKADLKIVEGDARLSLIEQADQSFDLLVLDAFSSDSIPVHLLTVEAIQLYLKKLKPNGILAFHVSNRYLKLSPVLAGAAERLGKPVRYQEDVSLSDEEAIDGKLRSLYFLLGASEESFAPMGKAIRWDKLYQLDTQTPWTDERSNILEAWNREDYP